MLLGLSLALGIAAYPHHASAEPPARTPTEPDAVAADQTLKASSSRALAFAQAACGGCHAVERYELSPNPKAPPFIRIVNLPGLSSDTLSAWLRDAHNYPEEMDFHLDAAEVEALTAYMLTLRDPDYEPPSL